ncbi:hypothetical protein J2T13_001640 [Paenibacillus sp. DS2015]|uniref:YhcN/YlaJ family sporulation lipoprotein n=1 Tax=Paenibacillus sp. DS2015 TaxID=3373917 RepID=UPI003D22CCC0
MIRSKAINLSLTTALLVSMFGVSGCMTKEPANTNINTKNVRNTDLTRRIGVNSLRDGGDRLTVRNNNVTDQMTNLHFDSKLSAKIAAIKGVRSANVFLTNDNAYVAVSLDNTASNTVNNLSAKRGTTTHTDHLDGNRGLYGTMGTGSYGILRGMTTDNNNNSGKVETGNIGRRGLNVQNDNISGLNTKNKVTPLDNEGVRYNRTSTNSAAVDNIPTKIREQITSIVKKQVPAIKKVYASSDPDFVERLGTYATTYSNGANKVDNTNLVTDFKKLVYRIFPMHDSTMDPDK